MWAKIPPSQVRPGDWADNVTGMLDPREVAEVDHEQGTIRLRLSPNFITLPVCLENYTYSRFQRSVDE